MKKFHINQTTKFNILLAILLIGFAVASRWLPHAPNFAPIAAIALLGGALLPKKLAIVLPLTAMVLSDLLIGMHSTILFTWGSFVLVAIIGYRFLRRPNAKKVVLGSLTASILFFVISNFGVWLEGRMYALTFEGLMQCYYNAIPFFRNTLAGDLMYSGVLFGSYFAIKSFVQSRTPLLSHSR